MNARETHADPDTDAFWEREHPAFATAPTRTTVQRPRLASAGPHRTIPPSLYGMVLYGVTITIDPLYRFEELHKETGIQRTDEMGRGVDVHNLRHTFCSELGRAGVGLTQAQALMGHSTPVLTANLYTHLGVEDLRDAVNRMGARRSGSAGLRNPKEKTA